MKKAVIVSNNLQHCHDYCYYKRLKKEDFYFAADERHLQGIPKDMQIIVTHCSAPLDDFLVAVLFHQFTNIVLEDY